MNDPLQPQPLATPSAAPLTPPAPPAPTFVPQAPTFVPPTPAPAPSDAPIAHPSPSFIPKDIVVPPAAPSVPATPAVSNPLPASIPPAFVPPVSATSSSSGWKGVLVTVVTLIVIASGVTYAYVGGYFSSAPAPADVYALTLQSLSSVNSVSYLITSSLTSPITPELSGTGVFSSSNSATSTAATGTVSMLMSFAGSYDITDAQATKSHTIVTIDTSSTVSTARFSAGAEALTIGKVLYVRLTNAPDLGFFSLKPLENQWIKFEQADLVSRLGIAQASTTSPSADLTVTERQTLARALFDHPIITITTALPSETIAGVKTYHYGFTLNKDQVAALVSTLENVAAAHNEQMASSSAADIVDELRTINLTNGEIWIGTKDHYPYKLKMGISDASPSAIWKGTDTIEATFSDYNKPLNVAAPTDAKNFDEIIGSIFSGFGTTSTTSATSTAKTAKKK